VFASAVLLLTAPVLALAALAVRLGSPGPALFRQTRMGKGGVPFDLFKLRGMYVDASERWPELYDYAGADPQGRFHPADDPRITPVGRIIRRFSIDELPNFVNVLAGHMSIVGPRPEIPELSHLYGDRLDEFLSVRPGVTSPAKARGRDELTFAETVELELDYVRRRSVLLDLQTIALTAINAIRGARVQH
jgi:lipopolysaccharide/colanic/teichoic acid biosynthesis glycosyltransferase